jgi:hypothetical protein
MPRDKVLKTMLDRKGRRDAHPTGSDPCLEIVADQCAFKEVEIENCTHLAINFGCTEETNQGKNYDREAG